MSLESPTIYDTAPSDQFASALPTLPVLFASGIALSYGKRRILNDASLTVEAGESVSIMGVSGSGKSSLLGCLSGLITPEKGNLQLNGRSLYELSDRKRAEARLQEMGFVFQFGELMEELTLLENLTLPLLLQRVQSKAAVHRARAVLSSVGIDQLANSLPAAVSGGEAQRAAVARAMVSRPRIVFADEPTGSLDDAAADTVLSLLTSYVVSSGAALVIVTHSRRVASACDRHYMLAAGVLSEASGGESQ